MHWLTAAWEALVRQEEPSPTAGLRIAAALAGAVLVLWVVGRGDLSDPPDRTATVVIIVWAALVDMLLWLGWRLAARGRRNAGAILCAVATVLVFLLAVLLGLLPFADQLTGHGEGSGALSLASLCAFAAGGTALVAALRMQQAVACAVLALASVGALAVISKLLNP